VYAAIWRRLPGPTALRVVIFLVAALGIAAALWLWVFPPLYEVLEFDDGAVG
jgi:hypothetical protein